MADLARFGGQRSAVGGHWRLNPCQIAGVSVSEFMLQSIPEKPEIRKYVKLLDLSSWCVVRWKAPCVF